MRRWVLENPKVVAIIQARMSSKRLPNKVLADIAGRPMLWQVVDRVRRVQSLDQVVVATSEGPGDMAIADFCVQNGVQCFRGSHDDVLNRYYQASKLFQADVIIRLTADCPLLDPTVIEKVVQEFLAGHYDYVSNTLEPTYPNGLDTEVLRREALERAWCYARLKSERAHVTPYIWKRPSLFRLGNVKHDHDLSRLRWTVDEPEDLEFVRRVYSSLAPTTAFGMADILGLLQRYPDLVKINAKFHRDEGYQKSLREDIFIVESERKVQNS